MRLSERIHLVASGRMGFGLTDDYDCHVYLLDGGDECALLDAGGGRDLAGLIQHIEAGGLAPERVRYLLLTAALFSNGLLDGLRPIEPMPAVVEASLQQGGIQSLHDR